MRSFPTLLCFGKIVHHCSHSLAHQSFQSSPLFSGSRHKSCINVTSTLALQPITASLRPFRSVLVYWVLSREQHPAHLYQMWQRAVRETSRSPLRMTSCSRRVAQPTANGEVCKLPFRIGTYNWDSYFCGKGFCPTTSGRNSSCTSGLSYTRTVLPLALNRINALSAILPRSVWILFTEQQCGPSQSTEDTARWYQWHQRTVSHLLLSCIEHYSTTNHSAKRRIERKQYRDRHSD